jgi:chemotaxis protein MotB
MADAKRLQPIIIKRIKKGGHSAHGGAWKIAYADFVTAMMAFFLLMWLLGSTTEGDKKGIADYFSSPLKVALMGGPGSGGSNSILTGGGRDLSQADGQTDGGDAARTEKLRGAQTAQAMRKKEESEKLDKLREKIVNVITNNPKLIEFADQIRLEKTPDGLHIQIVDAQNRPMFDSGASVVKPYMKDLLRAIGSALTDVDNRISLAGHTDSKPFGNGMTGYSNWELSAERANAVRRELEAAGMPDGKLIRVEGLSSSQPLEPDDPQAAINRRISIVIMTKEAEERANRTYRGGTRASDGAETDAENTQQSSQKP